jgi:flagellin-specific chaperone FliS
MLTRQSTSAYHNATAGGATYSSLLQLVYSNLAQDLMRAAHAVRGKNIEARCAASTHALALLGHLESWLQDMDEHTLAESLQQFYNMLRVSILRLQAAPDAAMFETCAQLVLDTRAAWQAKEGSLLTSSAATAGLQSEPAAISFHA